MTVVDLASTRDSYWDYRLFAEEVQCGDHVHMEFTIRETFYENDEPWGACADPAIACGHDKDEVLEDLKLMVEATMQPILILTPENKIIEYTPPREEPNAPADTSTD